MAKRTLQDEIEGAICELDEKWGETEKADKFQAVFEWLSEHYDINNEKDNYDFKELLEDINREIDAAEHDAMERYDAEMNGENGYDTTDEKEGFK